MEKIIKLSVIIPTKNRCYLLKETLDSIVAQTFNKDNFEVIIVDNGSTDKTKTISFEYTNKLQINYIYEPRPGLHEGRHAGLRASLSDILVYADDDIVAFPEWLETIYNLFQKDENIVLVGGKNLPKFESNPPFWILENWNSITKHGQVSGDLSIIDLGEFEKEVSPFYIFGCNFSVRKNIVLDAGGFNPDGMPFELIRFRGNGETHISKYVEDKCLKAYYHPLASVYHWVSNDRMTEEYFYKRRYMQGISDAYSILRYNVTKESKKNKYLHKFKLYLKILLGLEQIKILNEINNNLKTTDFDKNLVKYYNKGYNYLINCYASNQEIRNWINKKKYI